VRKIGICSRRFRSREDPEDGRFAALALRSHDELPGSELLAQIPLARRS